MNGRDLLRYSFVTIERSPARTALMLLAMAIAVTSVILLTGLGEAARRYVVRCNCFKRSCLCCRGGSNGRGCGVD